MKTAGAKARSKPEAAPGIRLSFSTRASALILIGITVILLVPFAGKAFNMDDPLFMWSAKYIHSHFLDPYGFRVNWYLDVQPMWNVTKNPPLACYYIALWAFIIGWSEPALHLAFLIPAIAVVLGTFFLAREFCAKPLEATLAAILTPVFLISGTTVMCDVMMLAFWVWAVFLWVRGMEKNRHGLLATAMVLVTLSALTKYFGIALIPLLAVYSIVKTRRPGMWMLHLLIPVAILAGYQVATKSLYGRGLLSDAGGYAAFYQADTLAQAVTRLLTGFIFTGGCILTALFFAPLLWSRRGLTIGFVIAVLAFVGFSLKPIGTFLPVGPLWPTGLQMALLFAGGVGLLALAVQDYLSRRDALSLVLLLWVAGTFIFASVLNWSVNGRSILPMAPAAGILIMRRIGRLHPTKDLTRYMCIPLAAALIVSLLVLFADYQLADSGRNAAGEVASSRTEEGRTIWFEGHWGFQYYMESEGGKAVEFATFEPKKGDILILPSNNTNLLIEDPDAPCVHVFIYRPIVKLSTMHKAVGAGFFSDTWGPLPFAIGPLPPEYYGVFQY